MCGICGVWNLKGEVREGILKKMNETLKKRGPDDEGWFLSFDRKVGLAQRRLSILDLSPQGHQPMNAGDCWITFNGEIYNFNEIKDELLKKGHSFKGTSDTEVILKSYLEWGIMCIEKFRGMFAFCIWDEKKQKMFLARDRAGIKPLYYHWDNSLLVFGSELKAVIEHNEVKKEISFDALSLFFQMGCIPSPYSIFKNIYKLEAGHYLEIDKSGKMNKRKYWDVQDYYLKQLSGNNKSIDFNEARDNLEEILIESFKLRMVSDVEVGMFLSGGIDSSTVAAILTKKLGFSNIKTFTIGFKEEAFNEAGYAKKVAEFLGTDHHEFYCSINEAKNIIPLLSEIYDEPFGDSSSIPTFLVSKFAREFVKVSLSADGGDETFAGYDRYGAIEKIFKQFQIFPKQARSIGIKVFEKFNINDTFAVYKILAGKKNSTDKLKKQFSKLQRKMGRLNNLVGHPNDIISFYQILGYGFWKFNEVQGILRDEEKIDVIKYFQALFCNPALKKIDNISQMQLMDYKTYMADDILVKVDRSTMAFGLEGRDPLLDHKIIEYAASLPLSFKYKNGSPKYILKEILYKYVPKELLDRPKQGFSIPLEKWLRGDLKFLMDEYLCEQRIKKEGIFDWETIRQEKHNFLHNKIDYTDHLWLLIVFEMWKERWYH